MTDKVQLDPQPNTTVIEAGDRVFPLDLGTLWEYRELLMFMIWRDWSVRYKQTVIGVGWVVLQPLATVLIFSIVFGVLFQLPSEGFPYPLYLLGGLVPWRLYTEGVSRASSSLINNAHLVNKVYFPRLIMPITSIITALTDFIFLLIIFIVAILIDGSVNPFTVRLVALPVFILLAMLLAAALGLWFSAMNVKYRDVNHFIPFLMQVWLYMTPVLYPITIVFNRLNEPLEILYQLNPMTGVVSGFRWVLLGTTPPDLVLLAINFVTILVVFIGGLFYFSRMEQTFGDVI